MGEDLYMVLEGNTILASKMTLDTALIMVKGYFDHYYEEPRLTVTIERLPRKWEAADGGDQAQESETEQSSRDDNI